MNKILLINSMKGGGAERKASRLIRFIKFEKIILLEKDAVFPIDLNITYHLSAHTSKTSSIFKTLFVLIYSYRLAIHTKGRFYQIYSLLERANYVNIISKLFFKHQSVISVECNPKMMYGRGLNKIHFLFIKWLYPHADKIICISNGVKEGLKQIVNIPENKMVIIPNPIDIDEIERNKIAPLSSKLDQLFTCKVIITVGRLIEIKNQNLLIDALAEIKKKEISIKLFILGIGPLKDKLMRHVSSIGLVPCDCADDKPVDLQADVYFGGFDTNPFKFINRSKVFVLTSETEGLPIVILEALACAVPVISTDCPSGPREILSPKTSFHFQLVGAVEVAEFGILVPVNQADFLVESITKIFADHDLYMKYVNASRARAADFSYESIADQYNEVLN